MGGLAIIRTFRVPITGQVVSQGMYDVSGASRLTDLLDKAGGITPAGSWTSIQIIGSEGDTTEVDITGFLLNGCMQSNPVLSLGDRVHIPEAEEFVSIEGAVKLSGSLSTGFGGAADQAVWSGSSRGMIEYIPGETVSRLVKRIGGTRTWADRDSCYVLRVLADGEQEKIIAPLDNPSIDPDLLLKNRWFLIKALLIIMIPTIVITFMLKKKYTVTTIIMPPEDQSASGLSIAGLGVSEFAGYFSGGMGFSLPLMTTMSDVFDEILKSRTLAEHVILSTSFIDSTNLRSIYDQDEQIGLYWARMKL